jgi:mRNA-degrading endonuclease RelE of RelBE toxin-antitoxin system
MVLKETARFSKQRKKLKSAVEKDALKNAINMLSGDPEKGKKLKGEFCDLRSLRYQAAGRARRLVYKLEGKDLILFSFGPREGIYR